MSNFTKIAIALGGNFAETPAFFDFAVKKLSDGGLCLSRLSPIIRTTPEGCAAGTPDFYNGALTGEWAGSAMELLLLCQQIEMAAGRPADHRSDQSRTLDLDLILFGDLVIDEPGLIIPHPRAASRAFVLMPLAAIAPDWIFPDTGITVAQCLARL